MQELGESERDKAVLVLIENEHWIEVTSEWIGSRARITRKPREEKSWNLKYTIESEGRFFFATEKSGSNSSIKSSWRRKPTKLRRWEERKSIFIFYTTLKWVIKNVYEEFEGSGRVWRGCSVHSKREFLRTSTNEMNMMESIWVDEVEWEFEAKKVSALWPADDDNWHFCNLLRIPFSFVLYSSSDVGSSWQFEGLLYFLFSTVFQLFFPFPHTSTLLLYLMIFSRVKFHIRISHGFVRSQLQLEMPTRCEDEMERAQSIFRPDDCSPALQWRVMGMGELKTRNFKLFNLESSSVCKRSSSCVVHEENFLEKHSDMLCLAVWKNGKCVHKYISEMNWKV